MRTVLAEKLAGIIILSICITGCARLHTAVTPSRELWNITTVYVSPFKCDAPEIGERLTTAVKIELMKRKVMLKDDPSADLTFEGKILLGVDFMDFGKYLAEARASSGEGALGTGSDPLSGSVAFKRHIRSVSFVGKDTQGNIIIIGTFGQPKGFFASNLERYSPEWVGRQIGRNIFKDLRQGMAGARK
jgi:hypothetical protein